MNQPLQVKHSSGSNEAVMLLRAILAKQDEQNALLKALVEKQHVQTRATAQWKKDHPELSQRCKQATDKAALIMDGLIEHLVEDMDKLEDDNDWDSTFMLDEFIDKYGHKLPQFSGLLQVLSQLGEA